MNKKTSKLNPIETSENKVKFKNLSVAEKYEIILDQKTKSTKLKYLLLSANSINDIFKHHKKTIAKKYKNKSDFNKANIFEIRNLNLWYKNGKKQALFDINLDIKKNKVTSLIGPSGCGKSTFIRNLNKMNDLIENVQIEGSIYFNGKNIKSKSLSEIELRTKVGMVFQKPAPFEMSIYDNVAFGPKNHGIRNPKKLDAIVEEALKNAALWDEVKDELNASATGLSGGQQQRLCIARAIALEPDVLLMDEPTSALDPIATSKIERLIKTLSKKVTIIIVTHSMAQAQRVSDETVFFYQGKIIESGSTKNIFTKPQQKRTRDYVNGRIG